MALEIGSVSRLDRSNDQDVVLSWYSWRGKNNHGSYSNRRALRKISRRFEYLHSLFLLYLPKTRSARRFWFSISLPFLIWQKISITVLTTRDRLHLKRSQVFCTMSYLCILRSSLLSTLLMSSRYLNERHFCRKYSILKRKLMQAYSSLQDISPRSLEFSKRGHI
jgi:hypothetical protein